MLERIFNSPSGAVLNQAMDAAVVRNKVIADNLANVETPGFKRKEVIFEEKLREYLNKPTQGIGLKVTDSRHIEHKSNNIVPQAEIREMKDLAFRNDGNNVDVDVENAKLGKNKIYYDAMVQSMNNELRLLRIAITGRG